PETEGDMGVGTGGVHRAEKEEDVEALDLKADKILVTNQTTMSKWDTEHLMKKVKEKYPQAEIYNEICLATQLRQEAVANQARGTDLVIVVGDPRSNNSNRLAQVAREKIGRASCRDRAGTEEDEASGKIWRWCVDRQ